MPAPTAIQRAPEALAQEAAAAPPPTTTDADEVLIDASLVSVPPPTGTPGAASAPSREVAVDVDGRPHFAPAGEARGSSHSARKGETRKVAVPPHRFSPLKAAWPRLYTPLVEHLGLQVRMNVKERAVELRTPRRAAAAGAEPGALQKGADFVRAFALGFDVDDAVALLRLDDLYVETFEIRDVKTLHGEHLARAVGRIAGKDGKTKFAIENTTKTRIVLADQKIHILGGFQNLRMAREAVVSLILGSPPGKVYGNLRTVAARQKERF